MSNYLAVATVTGTLNHLISRFIAPEGGATVSNVRPDTGAATLPTKGVNIFLYEAMPDGALTAENLPLRSREGELMARPRIALELHYLLTFYGDETRLEPQRLLGRVAAGLHGRSVLTRSLVHDTVNTTVFDYLLGSNLEHDVELVKISSLPLSLEELTKLWSMMLQAKYTLSSTYKATAVFVEADEPVTDVLPVRERRFASVALAPPSLDRLWPQRLVFGPRAQVTLSGANLSGDRVRVRFGAQVVDALSVSDTRVIAVPPPTAQAGATVVSVIKAAGEGSTFSMESEPASLLLLPVVLAAVYSAPLDVNGQPVPQVLVSVQPTLGQRQMAEISVSTLPGAATPGEWVVPALPRNGVADSFIGLLTGVPTGTYLLRARVDGAASPLTSDETPGSPTFGQFNGPLLLVP